MKKLIVGIFLLTSVGVFGEEYIDKDFLEKGPLGVEKVTTTRKQLFSGADPERMDVVSYQRSFVYDRRGHFLSSYTHGIEDAYLNLRRYEYDYGEQGELKECRVFMGATLDFEIDFSRCSKQLLSYHLTHYDADGEELDYMGEDWDCDREGRVVRGRIYYRKELREITCRYAERPLECRNQHGDGKLTEVFAESLNLAEGKRKLLHGRSLFYTKDNQLEEVVYYD